MTPRYVQRLEQALALQGFTSEPRPRLMKLYADARSEWLSRKGLSTDLHALLLALAFEKEEVSAEDDAQIRAAYEIRGAA